MTKQLKQLLQGVGSVMDILPAKDYQPFLTRRTPNERLEERFARVGAALNRACATHDSHGQSPHQDAR